LLSSEDGELAVRNGHGGRSTTGVDLAPGQRRKTGLAQHDDPAGTAALAQRLRHEPRLRSDGGVSDRSLAQVF
jgi:hypothetical protein